MTFRDLMAVEPTRWGLRGDPFLWREMREMLSEQAVPSREAEIREAVSVAFEALTGQSIEARHHFFVERFAHGGMSSGHVDPAFWRTRALEHLIEAWRNPHSRLVGGFGHEQSVEEHLTRDERPTRSKAMSIAKVTDVVDALRRGTVPENALETFAVGLDHLAPTLDEELSQCAAGRGRFKAVRGEYGTGKTFFSRWMQERARQRGFATAEVQISESETPLHRLETVYRRLVEHLSTTEVRRGALRSIIDGWFFTLEEEACADGSITSDDELMAATDRLMTTRLREVERSAPAFGACLRAYRRAVAEGDEAQAAGLIAWMSGQPNVAASIKRQAGIKGDLDHFGAFGFLQGLLAILRDSGFEGLVLVLDEVETLQRVRGDVREKSLNALRQLMDEVDAGRFPGLYLLITGTPAFFDGPQGVQRLQPLAQRLHVDFEGNAAFDNPRAVQIRLRAFDNDRLKDVGRNIRDLYASGSKHGERIRSRADDALIDDLASAVAGQLGGKVGIAPRIYLKKLVADVLDRIDQFEAFDPRVDYRLLVKKEELTTDEARELEADDVPLDL